MRVQIQRKTEVYGISKFFPAPRLNSLNVHLKQKGEALFKKNPNQNTENYISFLRERILQN